MFSLFVSRRKEGQERALGRSNTLPLRGLSAGEGGISQVTLRPDCGNHPRNSGTEYITGRFHHSFVPKVSKPSFS